MVISDKRLVIVDVDEVLLDLNKSVEKRVQEMGYLAYKTTNIFTYGLNKDILTQDLPPEQRVMMDNGLGCPRDLLFKLYSDVSIFENANLFEGCVEGLNILSEKANILIHSLSFNFDIASFKINLFKKVFKDILLGYSFCIGSVKLPVPDAYAVFEDSISNIAQYHNDTIKFLVDRPHNCEKYNKADLFGISNLVRVPNFRTGVDSLLEFL